MTARQAQHLLGYLGFDPGTVDGIWGPKSRKAAAAFRKAWDGVETDGALDAQLEALLPRAVAEGMPRKDFWEEIQYFTREEFRCKCGGRYCGGFPAEMKEPVAVLADRAREHFGAPGHVVSGLRCPRHNANCGGVKNSRHMSGEAVDLRIDGVEAEQLLAFVKEQPEVRYAYKINGTNVHFDISGEAG